MTVRARWSIRGALAASLLASTSLTLAGARLDTSEQVLQRARQLRYAGKHAEASREVRTSLSNSAPADAIPLRMELMRIELDRGDATRAFEQCAALKRVDERRGWACDSEVHLARGRASLALEAAERAVAEQPADLATTLVKARAIGQAGQFEQAEALFRTLLEVAPLEADVHRYFAELVSSRHADLALLELGRAQALAPGDPTLLYALAVARSAEPYAVDLLKRALQIRPTYIEARALLGRLLANQGVLKDAEVLLSESVSKAPQRGDWRAWYAAVLLGSGRTEDAFREATAAVRLSKTGAVKQVLADVLAKRGDIDLAAEAYEQAYAAERTNPEPLVRGARACLQQRRPTTARAFAERAVGEFAEWAPAWEALADVLVDERNYGEARRAYLKALASKGSIDAAQIQRKLVALQK